MKRSKITTSFMLIAVLAIGFAIPAIGNAAPPAPPRKGPPLSQLAYFSRFARENGLGAQDLARLEINQTALEAVPPAAGQANADWNARPQNETSIALHPTTGRWIIGANDYGIGGPIGTGVYNSEEVNYFPPFPLLFGKGGSGSRDLAELPIGTGDPALAYGRTISVTGIPPGLPVVYMASLGFSTNFCENGVFVYRSLDNGATWTRPIVPAFAPPRGLRTVVYYDSAQNCTVIHDKEWIVVDNTGGPHDGRVYVTWTQFIFADGQYKESPILMAYSDNNGNTFSDPIEISGANAAVCRTQVSGLPGECDENQASVPVVASDGTLIAAFENEQFNGAADGFRDQYLVVRVNPNTFAVQGPYKVADLFDGLNDYPINQDGRQTLCNSNFRQWSVGNIAIGPEDELYVVWSDNRRHAGEFPFPTFVGSAAPYACPAGKATDADIFISASTDGGVNWSAPVQVNQDKAPSTTNDKDQWFPWVAVAPGDGRVDVIFYDRRDPPGNKLTHTYLARSSDGGATWTEIKVSDFASNFDNAFFGVGTFIGDYNGLAIAEDGTSYPVWTGVSPGKFDSDVFFDTIAPKAGRSRN